MKFEGQVSLPSRHVDLDTACFLLNLESEDLRRYLSDCVVTERCNSTSDELHHRFDRNLYHHCSDDYSCMSNPPLVPGSQGSTRIVRFLFLQLPCPTNCGGPERQSPF